MTYAFIQALLASADEYEHSLPAAAAASEAGFGQWLLARAGAEAIPEVPEVPEIRRRAEQPFITPESEICTLLTITYRYVRGYVRQALADSPLANFDDFTYLAALLEAEPGALTKSELIELNIQEKATGIEIIRRLLARGFVTQTPHPTDKRAKHLRLTHAGRGVLFAAFGPMGQVAALSIGPLTPPEKQLLLRLLSKLDGFHHPIFLASKADSFETLVERHRSSPKA